MENKQLEKYSSAFTLSDMEIFVFPDLLFALVLANIMSPEIWKWKSDPWFAGIGKLNPLKKVHRVKQYIMDQYDFNLDLETWGLTDKQTELNRFSDFIEPGLLEKSNALFGYQGDKYYFDIDIRRHFGLEKYDTDIIPYWKTETVEAMNAFRFKQDHPVGAGECVSLACLYAAALFIVAEIPLEKIFMMGTPLHSQNFILIEDGILTNNRRIVTKTMWVNGTELSALARRALENEQVTIVAHCTGWIHSLYPEATIDKASYHLFHDTLNRYLDTPVNWEIFINFLRDYSRFQKFFQLSFLCQGTEKFIRLERAFGYEHSSKHRIGDKMGKKVLCEIEEDELTLSAFPDRFILSSGDDIFRTRPYKDFILVLLEKFPALKDKENFLTDLKRFVHLVPRLPSENKTFPAPHRSITKDTPSGELTTAPQCIISPSDPRDSIISKLKAIRSLNPTVDLAFYSGRHMDSCDWKPFLKAAFERNPVSIEFFREKEISILYQELQTWPNESIYEENRLALPDEAVNFHRGDGIEKALTLMNIYKSRHHGENIHLTVAGSAVRIHGHGFSYEFTTGKSYDGLKI